MFTQFRVQRSIFNGGMPFVARCEDLTGSGVAAVLSHTGDSEAAGGCGSCPWLITDAGVGGACWTTVSVMSASGPWFPPLKMWSG